MKGTGVTMSIGAVVYEKGLSMDLITKRADEAMYLAKKERNNVKTYADVLEVEKAKKQEGEKNNFYFAICKLRVIIKQTAY